MKFFNNLVKNKSLILIILILDIIGVIFAVYTYRYDILKNFNPRNFFIIPFFMVSFWLFLFAAIFNFYIYKDREIPVILAGVAFIYSFVYGFGSAVFYPLFMTFVRGVTLYHVWNVFAHGFVGLQSLMFLSKTKSPKIISFLFIFSIFFVKDILDIFYGGFLYFVNFNFPYFLKIIVISVIIAFQLIALLLFWRADKRLK